jgi:hypothetical protein
MLLFERSRNWKYIISESSLLKIHLHGITNNVLHEMKALQYADGRCSTNADDEEDKII